MDVELLLRNTPELALVYKDNTLTYRYHNYEVWHKEGEMAHSEPYVGTNFEEALTTLKTFKVRENK